MYLGLNVGREVIGEEVVIAARCDGVHYWLKEVCPAEGPLPHQIHHMLKALIRLHSTGSLLWHCCIGCEGPRRAAMVMSG